MMETKRPSEWENFFHHIKGRLHYNAPPSKEDIEDCKKKCELHGFPIELINWPEAETGFYDSNKRLDY